MRVRLVDAPMLGRWSAIAMWFGVAGLTPFEAISPTLAIFTMLAMLVGFLGVSRLSPVGTIARRLSGRLGARLAHAPRVELVGYRPHVDGLVALLGAGMLWILPLCAGAYAMKNPGPGGITAALVILALTTFGVAKMILGGDRDVVTFGADGLRTKMWGFVPYTAITGAEVDGDDLRVHRDGGPDLLLTIGGLVGVVAAELSRRRTTPIAIALPATAEAREVHARVAAVPAEELLATLRDGSVPREERVRVAEVLRAAAPDEVERLAAETADAELATMLRGGDVLR